MVEMEILGREDAKQSLAQTEINLASSGRLR